MLKHPSYTRDRIRQLVERFSQRFYPRTCPVSSMTIAGPVDRISCGQAMKLEYRPATLGMALGPDWATYWVKIQIQVPGDWSGHRVDLRFASRSEAMLWINGQPVNGLNPAGHCAIDRQEAMLLEKANGGESLECFVEIACNDLFGNSHGDGLPLTRAYVLDRCELGCFDPLAWELYHDLLLLSELEREQSDEVKVWRTPLDKDWGQRLLFELNAFCNEIDEADRATWPPAMRRLKALLSQSNGSYVHQISAMGHGHMDTAWLWPLAETRRKCGRTFSNQIRLMERYPAYRFACSQAYQYMTVQQDYPELYQQIKQRAASGQWVPVGGTWIEPDCNLPSGESLCRQFLFGQRFFQKEFGRRCREFWNPDVFGYNGQLPQIMRQAGIDWFLTQKLSWNRFNQPMHHTFHWQGIDGSRVLAHFPPANTYNASVNAGELRGHVHNYKDAERSQHAIYLFGFGDGGGGAHPTMLEKLTRSSNLLGLPTVTMRSSREFFTLLEQDATDVTACVGELYFEYHRGTYTTQAATKKGNRQSEFLLHNVEFLSLWAGRLAGMEYPADSINELWRILLLNQFHDILPGSSIKQVYDDAARHYQQIAQQGGELRDAAMSPLAKALKATGQGVSPVNPTSFDRHEVAPLPDGTLAMVQAPAYGVGQIVATSASASAIRQSDRLILQNDRLKAEFADDGRLLSLIHLATGRQVMQSPGNLLELYDDHPTRFDAWDMDPFHLETQRLCPAATSAQVLSAGGLRAEIAFERSIGKASGMVQTVRLDAASDRLEFHCRVDWHENEKMLKVAYPAAICAMNATYEMQFGAVERPTHFNDSFALARYEGPAHKWVDLSEHGFGLAILSESKYGFSVHQNVMRLSMLRSPMSPDPTADRGHHEFAYALYPHAGSWQQSGVVRQGYGFNQPLLWLAGQVSQPVSLASVVSGDLVLDTIKKAEDSDAMVLRLYEPHGGRGSAKLKIHLPVSRACRCNILEDEGESLAIRDGEIDLPYTPWQIISLKLS